MSDHEPPTSLDKPPPGDDHASVVMRVVRLEIIVEEIVKRLDRMESRFEARFDRLDAKFDMLYRLLFGMMTVFIGGLLALCGRAFGLY
jgi:hypothetical protein